jgi:hypothetical protein
MVRLLVDGGDFITTGIPRPRFIRIPFIASSIPQHPQLVEDVWGPLLGVHSPAHHFKVSYSPTVQYKIGHRDWTITVRFCAKHAVSAYTQAKPSASQHGRGTTYVPFYSVS